MAVNEGATSEKQQIEEYLKLYCIEDCLDEAVNGVLKDRPKNPYKAIALAIESKSLAEIVNVTLSTSLVSMGTWGVTATVHTNISSFDGTAAYSTEEYSYPTTKNLSAVEEKICAALVGSDPVQMQEIDSVLQTIVELSTAESLAVSMACCRAGARHKGLPLYQFINELYASSSGGMLIPIPVFSLLSKTTDMGDFYQDIVAIPLGAQTYQIALQKALEATRCITKVEPILPKSSVSTSGCRCFTTEDVKSVVKQVADSFVEAELFDLKLGINMRASHFVVQPDEGVSPPAVPSYQFDGVAGPVLGGAEIVDTVIDLMTEAYVVSFDEPMVSNDETSLAVLKKKIHEAVLEMKSHGKQSKSSYFVAGIGGDAHSHLQVVIDSTAFKSVSTAADEFSSTSPYNCVKLRIGSCGTMSEALDLCRKAKQYHCHVLVSDCGDASLPESGDTMAADFAVAIGATQFLGGGLLSQSNAAKFNRILAIQQENPSLPFVAAKFRKNAL